MSALCVLLRPPQRWLPCLLLGATVAVADPVTIAGVDYLGDLPTLVADRNGLFDDALDGDVRVEYGRAGRDNVERLLAGEVSFATMAMTPVVLHEASRDDAAERHCLRILAGLHRGIDSTRLFAPAAGAARTVRDLAGRTVGVMPGTNAEPMWWHLARAHGLERDAVSLARLPIDSLADALADGLIDAAILWDPWPALIEANRAMAIHAVGEPGAFGTKWVLVATADTLAQRPEDARAVLRAYRQAINLIERNPESVGRLLAERHAVAPETLESRWGFTDFDLIADWSLILHVSQILEWAAATGVLTGEGADLTGLFDFTAIQDAHPAGLSLDAAAMPLASCQQ